MECHICGANLSIVVLGLTEIANDSHTLDTFIAPMPLDVVCLPPPLYKMHRTLDPDWRQLALEDQDLQPLWDSLAGEVG